MIRGSPGEDPHSEKNHHMPVLLCMEAQASTCTWAIALQQSLCLAYKDPICWQKPQGCLSKPTNRLHGQPQARRCRTQKTQWVSPAGTSLKAVRREAQAQPLQKDPPQTNLHTTGLHQTAGVHRAPLFISGSCLGKRAAKRTLRGALVCPWACP